MKLNDTIIWTKRVAAGRYALIVGAMAVGMPNTEAIEALQFDKEILPTTMLSIEKANHSGRPVSWRRLVW